MDWKKNQEAHENSERAVCPVGPPYEIHHLTVNEKFCIQIYKLWANAALVWHNAGGQDAVAQLD